MLAAISLAGLVCGTNPGLSLAGPPPLATAFERDLGARLARAARAGSRSELMRREFNEVRLCLQEIGNVDSPLAYPIARNLQRVTKILNAAADEIKEINDQHGKRDEFGKPVIDPQKKKLVYNDFQDERDHMTELEQFDFKRFEVDFYEVRVSRLEGLELKGMFLSPLLDRMFIGELIPKEK